jgi:energy-coupling factor transport system substrate-specific component
VAIVLILLCIPALIAVNLFFMRDRGYYPTALAIVGLSLIPFFLLYERRKPMARELVLVASLIAIAVVSRAAFFMLPQVKPLAAVIIIAGVSLGVEAGFITGALAAFVSNFIFGQGPWTPWQMFALGLIGFLAGVLFRAGRLPAKRAPLAIFGGMAVLILYGPIVDTAAFLIFPQGLSWHTAALVYLSGLPFNIIHAVSTVAFLLIFAPFMIEKLDRVKRKFGL